MATKVALPNGDTLPRDVHGLSLIECRGQGGYDRLNVSFSLNGDLPPVAVAEPKSIAEAAAVMRYADENNLDVAVVGGHSLTGLTATLGIRILTAGLRNIAIDTSESTVTVGAGWPQEDLDAELLKHGFAMVASTFGSTSVIGAALIGGFGWLTGAYGMALDNIVSATVVLKDGSVVKTSQAEQTDLFWAIRGGGCNFGLVAEATFRVFEQQQDVFWALVTCPISSREDVVSAVAKMQNTISSRSALSTRFEINGGMAQICLRVFHNGDEGEAKRELAPVFSLPGATCKAAMLPYDRIHHTGVNIGSFSRDEIAAFCQDFLDTFRTCHALSFAVLGLDTRNTDKVMASASSASAFASRSDSTMTYIRATWQDPSADTEVESALDLFGRKWRSKVRDGPTAYPAFCIPGQITPEEVWGENYKRLRDIKRELDPDDNFSKYHKIEPSVR